MRAPLDGRPFTGWFALRECTAFSIQQGISYATLHTSSWRCDDRITHQRRTLIFHIPIPCLPPPLSRTSTSNSETSGKGTYPVRLAAHLHQSVSQHVKIASSRASEIRVSSCTIVLLLRTVPFTRGVRECMHVCLRPPTHACMHSQKRRYKAGLLCPLTRSAGWAREHPRCSVGEMHACTRTHAVPAVWRLENVLYCTALYALRCAIVDR